jgi:hypothetical protein
MRPETSMSTWIPALHAGMTDETPAMNRLSASPAKSSKENTKERKQ